MSFTNQNIAAFEAAIKQAAGALLAPHQVDAYQGATHTIKLHVGSRRANEGTLTGGAVADSQLIATIDYDDWMAKIGREPQKGDVIWWLGKRHAVERSVPAAPGENGVFFKVRLQG